ncbi:gp436 family protein [Roseovarius mucosus]|uniref:gp436 family protein n=1 Tax=Roseovarius mucosus TaxID=215743 RepID=UPI003F6EE355
MPYTTLEELTDRFGTPMLVSLTDRAEAATGLIDADVVASALADTDALIDGYLKARYVLPLSDAQPLVAAIARDIAIYKLHTYEPDAKITADYKQALASLKDIAAGTVQLSASGVVPASSGGGEARVTDRPRPMTGENLKGFI